MTYSLVILNAPVREYFQEHNGWLGGSELRSVNLE